MTEPAAVDFFFYGTLMDPDVLAAAIGRRVRPARARPATLSGWRRVGLKGTPYPVVVPGAATDRVEGLLVTGLTAADVRRLERYEGAAYGIETVSVNASGGETMSANVFVPKKGVAATDAAWDLETWRRRRKRRDLGLAVGTG